MRTMQSKQLAVFAIIALLVIGLQASPQTKNAHAAAGTAGDLSAGVSSVFLNTVVAVKAFNMDVSADYGLLVNNVITHNWTNSDTQTTKTFFMTFESTQVAEGQIFINLTDSEDGNMDVIFLTVTEVEDIVDTDFAFDLFTPFLILGILIAVLGAILGGGIVAAKKFRR